MRKLKNNINLFVINFVAMTVFWGGLIRRSFNADTITYMVFPLADINVEIRDGRYLIALFDIILYKLGTKTTAIIPLSIFVTLILFAVSITILQKIFKQFLNTENNMFIAGFYCALGLVFSNVLFSEYLMFPEVSIFYAIGFLSVTLGAYYHSKSKKLVAFVLYAVGSCIYQITLVYAAIILLFYYMLSHQFKWSVEAVIDEFLACFIPLSTGILNIISIRILGIINPSYAFRRVVSSKTMSNKIASLLTTLLDFLKNSYTLLPNLFFPALFFGFFTLCTFIILILSKDILSILYFSLVVVISMATLFAIPLLNRAFSFPPRMSFCLYLIQGLIAITFMSALSNANLIALRCPKFINILLTLRTATLAIWAYVWIQMIFCSFIISGRFVSNALDLVHAKAILREIENYEAETNVTVLYIEELHDNYAPAFYDESRSHYEQINEKIIGQTTRALIESISGRVFEKTNAIPSDIEERFKDKDWDYFDLNEQMVIRGDTAYLCIY